MQLGFHTLVCKTPCIGIATYGETHHSEVFSNNDSDTEIEVRGVIQR